LDGLLYLEGFDHETSKKKFRMSFIHSTNVTLERDLTVSGSTSLQGTSFNGNEVTNVADAVDGGSAVNLSQLRNEIEKSRQAPI
jgi:hypothetical protein